MNIQEIAKLSGVSAATVSRVFSHHTGVGKEIRAKVLEVARSHGYHPRLTGHKKNVVIITPYNSVYPVQSCVDMILMSLAQVLPERDFRLEILPVNNLERLDSIQFCGAVAIGCENADFPGWARRFPVPLVITDRAQGKNYQQNVYHVCSDEAQGMRLAIEHLHSRGCRRIGCLIHGTPDRGNASLRFQAIVAVLQRLDLPHDQQFVYFTGDGTERYVELIGKLLQHKVDALFCPGGNAGILALYALSLFNRRVPEDISLIASEQTFFSQFAVPPQTTISPDYHAMANAVGDILTAWLDSDSLRRTITLPYRLIIRDSVLA